MASLCKSGNEPPGSLKANYLVMHGYPCAVCDVYEDPMSALKHYFILTCVNNLILFNLMYLFSSKTNFQAKDLGLQVLPSPLPPIIQLYT